MNKIYIYSNNELPNFGQVDVNINEFGAFNVTLHEGSVVSDVMARIEVDFETAMEMHNNLKYALERYPEYVNNRLRENGITDAIEEK